MSKEQNIGNKDKALSIGDFIKPYLYMLPLVGMFFINKKNWTSFEYNLYYMYQYIMSFVFPLFLVFTLRWADVL